MAKRLYGGSIEVTPPAAPGTSVTDSIVNIPGIFKVQGTAIDAASIAVLEGVTASAAEINIMDGVTSTTAELNILDGVTSTTAELNILDGVTSTAAELNILDGVTASYVELNYNDITTLGTGAASKAVVLDAGEDYTWPATGVLTYGVLKDPAGTTLGATVAELNIAADASAQTETIDAAGVVSVTKRITQIGGTGAGAVTLAVPDATMLGLVKIIEMTAASGAITLALTNVDGGSAATTASFDAVGEVLILVAGVSKWHVIKEVGVTLS